MEPIIVYTDTKHSYAKETIDGIELRISRWLSKKEQQRHIDSLMRKVEKRHQGGEPLFQEWYDEGVAHGAVGTIRVQPSGKGLGLRAQVLGQGRTESVHMLRPRDSWEQMDASGKRKILLSLVKKALLEEVEREVRMWTVAVAPKRTLQKVSLKDTTSRWGSCTTSGNISMSLSSLLLPYPLFTYVCLHEVVHLEHAHHRSSFWDEVVRHMPDARERARALRSYSMHR